MKKIILTISIILILFFSVSSLHASDNETSDDFNNVQSLIDNSDDEIIKINGNFNGNGSAININKPITIKGIGSSTLNGESKSQIFSINSDNVTVENLIFINGAAKSTSAQYGGAIYSTGDNLRIINCTFINNNALYGGAVASIGVNTTIINCKFDSNTAQYSGGAVEIDGEDSYVNNCVFTNNAAGHVGCAVAWVGANGILSNSTFDNSKISLSKSPQFGGAVVWMAPNGTLTQSSFYNFKSKNSGAAVYWRGSQGNLSYCIFEKNNSTTDSCYFGNPDYLEYNYWADNYNSTEEFKQNKLIYYNNSYYAPENWVNIKKTDNEIKFVKNTGESLVNHLPDYNYSNVKISKNIYIIKKSTSFTSSNLITYCLYNGKTLKITLKSGNKKLASKKVQIKFNNKVYNKTTDKNGVVKLNVNMKKSGTYYAKVSFKEDTYYKSSSKTIKVAVKKQKVSFTVKKSGKKIKVVLKNQFKKALSKKLVKLTVNKKTYKMKTNSKGIVIFKINLKKTMKCKIKFAGDSYYKPLTKNVKIRVK